MYLFLKSTFVASCSLMTLTDEVGSEPANIGKAPISMKFVVGVRYFLFTDLIGFNDCAKQTSNKKPANLAVNRLNIKIKRFASIIQPSAPLPEQPL